MIIKRKLIFLLLSAVLLFSLSLLAAAETVEPYGFTGTHSIII